MRSTASPGARPRTASARPTTCRSSRSPPTRFATRGSRVHSPLERGGLLLGEPLVNAPGDAVPAVVFLRTAVPGLDDDATEYSLRLAAGVWDAARAALAPGEVVVGWFHSHPDIGAFFSGTDRRTQAGFFPHPFSVGWVIDPVRREQAWFVGPRSRELANAASSRSVARATRLGGDGIRRWPPLPLRQNGGRERASRPAGPIRASTSHSRDARATGRFRPTHPQGAPEARARPLRARGRLSPGVKTAILFGALALIAAAGRLDRPAAEPAARAGRDAVRQPDRQLLRHRRQARRRGRRDARATCATCRRRARWRTSSG